MEWVKSLFFTGAPGTFGGPTLLFKPRLNGFSKAFSIPGSFVMGKALVSCKISKKSVSIDRIVRPYSRFGWTVNSWKVLYNF